jgi:anthranilate phosphoribosyltransferase
MTELDDFTQRLLSRHNLSDADVARAAAALASETTPEDTKAAFLLALSDKGETPAEVAAFAREFRARAIDPGLSAWSADAIDIVGTGGDHAGGFNISSLVVLVLASAGVKVMKHGNRGITSKCGSADLLSSLGVQLDAPPEKLRGALDQLGFCFLFAPGYHPAFKHIAPVRKALAAQGRRTLFNILGPLVNPGRPAHVLLGVFADAWVPRLAEVLHLLGTSAGLAVHGRISPERGIDEMTTATPNRVRGFGRLREVDGIWEPAAYGFQLAPFEELQGGDVTANTALVEAILANKGPAGLVDTIVFNAATAMWICGRVSTVRDGVGEARERLLGGSVKAKIAATREFFQA